jgi:hypothetical protein
MALTKGVGFTNVRSFVGERFGASAWQELLDAMSKADREELESVLPVGWYDLALYARVIHAVDRKLGRGDLSLITQLDRFEAEKDLTTIHQFFLRFANANVVVEQTSKYWRRFHDTGVWETERLGDRGAIAKLRDWGVVDAGLCAELGSYLGRALELCGCRDLTMEQPHYRVRGDAHCEFRGRWRLRKDPPAADPAK